MKNVFFKSGLMAAAALLVTVSCTKELPQDKEMSKELQTCQMRLIGSKAEFDQPATKAGSSTSWAEGSTIFLRLNSPMGITLGTAVYKASTDVWTVSYYGSLSEDVANGCSAIYFEDLEKVENNVVTLNENSIIFEDQAGSYIFSGGDLVVTANLKPKTGRLHLQGTSGKVVKVYGISHYTTYDLSTNLFTNTADEFKTTVSSDGFTPYLYGFFSEANEPCIKVWIDAKEAYSRFLSKNLFKAGESGKLTIPTSSSYSGWSDGLIFTNGDVRMKMVAVEGGSFTMGIEGSSDQYYTPHQVKVSGYCIAETELTQQFTNGTSSSSLAPSVYSGWGYSTVNSLASKVHAHFDFPTEAQWEFAARGGVKSKNFLYSGSDSIDDVAWYSGNSNSVIHPVKQKLPNELGLYDMSGNAWEVVIDDYSPYPSTSQIDPLVLTRSSKDASRNYRLCRGGNYSTTYTSCTNTFRNNIYSGSSSSYTSSQYTYRLVLNWD